MFQGTPIGAGFCTTGLLVSQPGPHRLLRVRVQPRRGRQPLPAPRLRRSAAATTSRSTASSRATTRRAPSRATRAPAFGSTAQMKFTPMMFDGTHYTGKPTRLDQRARTKVTACCRRRRSSSSAASATRTSSSATSCAASTRRRPAARTTVTTPEIARYCVQGREAVDLVRREVLRHPPLRRAERLRRARLRVGAATRRSRQMLAKGTANIILVDMRDGRADPRSRT